MKFIRWLLYSLYDSKVKIFSIIIILTMAFFDFAAMKNLFIHLQVSDIPLLSPDMMNYNTGVPNHVLGYVSELNVYPFMLIVLLEGIPYFLGLEVTETFDKTTYKVNRKKFAKIGFGVGIFAMFVTFGLVCFMRHLVILKEGGWPDIFGRHGEITNKFIVQFGLMVSPILTSALAFIASLAAFKSESADELERKIDHLFVKYLNEQSKFHDVTNKLDDARTALWTTLTGSQNRQMPQKFDDYRKECFDKIRAKLIENVIIQYPGQISRYNSEIEGMLEIFIKQMGDARETNVPFEILSITTDDLFEDYDKTISLNEKVPIDAWNYSIAGDELGKELKKVLDNAIVVAQFKTVEKPYHMEGDF